MPLKILHIAPQNVAGMPLDFVKMHREFGAESDLITLYRNSVSFEEDICLDFQLPSGKNARQWRNNKIEKRSDAVLKFNKPKNIFEKVYFFLRDESNKKKIKEAINKYDLFNYDIYHFDGGMDLFRDMRFAKELKKRNKKIVCCYFGSDLRSRGVFKELDDMSDLNLTVEFDHLSLHNKINYIYFPYNEKKFSLNIKNNKKIKIIHSPTNRLYKGTEKIIKVINEVKNLRNIEFILLENIERNKVLEIKNSCDIAIDQVGGEYGGTGYGKNSIENLSMGVPTITEFSDEYLKFIKDNPFIHSDINSLQKNLISLIDDKLLRDEISVKGRNWVEEYHSFSSVNKQLNGYYEKFNII